MSLFIAGGVIALAVAVWVFVDALGGAQSMLFSGNWFGEVFQRFHFSKHQLLPSWWLGSGLMEAARHGWSESVLYLSQKVSCPFL